MPDQRIPALTLWEPWASLVAAVLATLERVAKTEPGAQLDLLGGKNG